MNVQKKIEEEIENEAHKRYPYNANAQVRFANGATFGYNLAMGEGWVKVEDRLPELYKDVVVWRINRQVVEIAQWDGTDWFTDTVGSILVQHWRPLPTPPEG